MTIRDIVEQGLYYARTCRSLWVFGFFVGLASGGSNGGGHSGGDGGGGLALGSLAGLFATEVAVAAIAVAVVLIVAGFVLRFLSEAALIEGVMRTRRGSPLTTLQGLRAGWAHWGVLLRIGLLYLLALIAGLVLLAAPCVLAFRALGVAGGVPVVLLALAVAVPSLVTLAMLQAFAFRIAVLENRSALDAIAKARLFLHGRLLHGLKLMVADVLGTLLIGLLAIVVIAPLVLLLAASALVVPVLPLIAIGIALLLPIGFVITAVLGTFRSSVWTIGYLTQVES